MSNATPTIHTQLLAKEYERAEHFQAWLRIAIDRPNAFSLWADVVKARGREPLFLIQHGEPTTAVDSLAPVNIA